MTDAGAADALERTTMRKIAWRIVPLLALMFFINFLDRTAMSFAGPNGFVRDLHLSAAQFGFAAGIFFLGYILLEIPSNLALHRFGARRWLSRIMVSWGLVSLLFTWVSSVPMLYALRLLLGIAEAGFFPGIILYLSFWAPARHRNFILALFYVAQPLTVVIGAPVAAALLEANGFAGLAGWRVMFLGVSLPAIGVGILAFFVLRDRPADADWLSPAEKAWLAAEFAREAPAGAGHGAHAGRALLDKRVWLLCLIYFGLIYGLYALTFFLPTIIGGFEHAAGTRLGLMQKGLITGVPYLCAALVLLPWNRDAKRRGVRTWHIGLPALAGALSVPLALHLASPAATMAAISVTAAGIFAALPNFWVLPSRLLSGAGAAAGIALINTIGNVAGFAAPFATGLLHDATGSYDLPMTVTGLMMALSALLAFMVAGGGDARRLKPASI